MNLVQSQPRSIGSLPPVGPLSFGLWRYTNPDVATSQALLETALDAGMNLVDNADVYGFDWGGTGFGTVDQSAGPDTTTDGTSPSPTAKLDHVHGE